MVKVEQDVPKFGTRYLVYQNVHFEPACAEILDAVRASLNSPADPSVIFLGQLHLDELSQLCRRAVRETRLKKN